MRIILTVTAGPHEGQTFSFEGHETFVVGRSKRSHLRLAPRDRYFSRVHFMIEINPPLCRVTDAGSRNGTHVNGQRVKSADLRDGDEIKAGHTVLRVSFSTPGLPETVAPPTVPGPLLPTEFPRHKALRGAVLGALARLATEDVPAIPGYKLEREIGRGGMGVVYLAVRQADGARVALKTIVPAVAGSSKQVERFLREADILRQLDHPHIVAFREMGEAGGCLYFAMDHVEGTSAHRLLRQRGPLPVLSAVRLMCQVLSALEYAHGKRFVHRDIKPGNILLGKEGGHMVARLADFGLARVYQASQLSGLTIGGEMGGTVAFMPPEQVTDFRSAQPPADQYSAAATLYVLLTDHFTHDFPESAAKSVGVILHADPVPIRTRRPEIPEGLARAIHRALAKEPADRFAGAAEMRRALLPFGR
jgi:serine/threonine-protein kinase